MSFKNGFVRLVTAYHWMHPGLLLLLTLLAIQSLPMPAAVAQVSMPNVFGEHMVLQRDKDILLWGRANANQSIVVTLSDKAATTQSDANGNWRVKLPPMSAGGPHKLSVGVQGQRAQISWNDILIGEVWLCSGQSNMQWTVNASGNAKEEVAAAKYPMIRHLGVKREQSRTPQTNFKGNWQVCSPETTGGFSAVSYYFARTLHQKLGIPIGVINSSWGGTRVEPWTPPVGFAQVPALSDIREQVEVWSPGSAKRREILTKHVGATQAWLQRASTALDNNQPFLEASPAFPAQLNPPASHQSPTKLYNQMIHPLVGLPLRGAIWYQGESNHNEGMLYYEKKKALIGGWRQLWGQGDFPFYFVQIAPFQYGNEDPTILPRFWEAQSKVTEIKNTGMVVISDIGNTKNIHPANKQDVGARLAFFALKNDYGKDVIAGGPVFESMEVKKDRLVLKFSNVGDGLKTNDGKPANYFEVAGINTGFKAAMATIDGDTVTLTSPDVDEPLAMRFAWHKLAEPNLVNSAGLPTSAFRAGKVPSGVSLIPELKTYQLVYDLDFSSVGPPLRYQTDNSEQISSFERVAYLLELGADDQDEDYVFVSMPAFTKQAKKLGVPVFGTGIEFQQPIGPMDVYSNVSTIKTGREIPGNIEFWPHNYAMTNSAKVTGASSKVYDIGDKPMEPAEGYGSMQVHNTRDKQTLLAFNAWSKGSNGDLGIGNAPGPHPDWTFTKSLKNYSTKRLRVFVK